MGKSTYILFMALLCTVVSYAQNEPAGRISGLVYADYYYNVQRDSTINSLSNTAQSGGKDLNGFDIRRMYFTYDHKISSEFSARVRLEADGKTLTQNNRIGVFLKDAYLRWKDILPGQDVYFGIQPTPAFEVSESIYGFRSLEKTILDLRGIVSSLDFGLAVRGKITGDLNYWILLGNNSGNSPEADRYKRLYAHISYSPFSKFMTTLYSDIRFRQKKEDPFNPQGENVSNNVMTTALFFGYSEPGSFNIGAEGFYQNFSNDIAVEGDLTGRNAGGLSLFGSIDMLEQLKLTLRYDIYDPGLNSDLKYDRRSYYIAGLSYTPVKNVQIIPNIVVESFEQPVNRSIEASITPRLTLAYSFSN